MNTIVLGAVICNGALISRALYLAYRADVLINIAASQNHAGSPMRYKTFKYYTLVFLSRLAINVVALNLITNKYTLSIMLGITQIPFLKSIDCGIKTSIIGGLLTTGIMAAINYYQ